MWTALLNSESGCQEGQGYGAELETLFKISLNPEMGLFGPNQSKTETFCLPWEKVTSVHDSFHCLMWFNSDLLSAVRRKSPWQFNTCLSADAASKNVSCDDNLCDMDIYQLAIGQTLIPYTLVHQIAIRWEWLFCVCVTIDLGCILKQHFLTRVFSIRMSWLVEPVWT